MLPTPARVGPTEVPTRGWGKMVVDMAAKRGNNQGECKRKTISRSETKDLKEDATIVERRVTQPKIIGGRRE